jgi:hypothetical protein
LRRMWETWIPTVFTLMTSASAMKTTETTAGRDTDAAAASARQAPIPTI